MSDPDDDLMDLFWEDDLNGIARLLDHHPELAKDPGQMINAVQLGSTEAVRLMIARGAPVSITVDDGFPLMHLAVERPRDHLPGKPPRDHSVLILLLAAGADVNERGENDWTPLHRAAAIGDIAACRILLEHGADRDALTRIDNYATPEEEARHLGENKTADVIRDFAAPG